MNYDPAAESSIALAQVEDGDAWRFDLITWIWLTSMDGDVGTRGLTSSVDASFSDFIEESDTMFALSGRLEVGKGRFAGFVDGVYNTLTKDDTSGPLGFGDIDVELTMAMVDFGLIYRVAEWDSQAGNGNSTAPRITLDVYGGARYQAVDMELDPANAATRSGDQDWIDPIVGGRLIVPLSQHFHLMTWADVGGFGVASDITWSGTGVFGYDFTLFELPAVSYGGYRAIGTDYSTGSGSEEFIWDVTIHGPLLGFLIRF